MKSAIHLLTLKTKNEENRLYPKDFNVPTSEEERAISQMYPKVIDVPSREKERVTETELIIQPVMIK